MDDNHWMYNKFKNAIQSDREQMGYLSQLEEVEESESTENELQAENYVRKHMEVTMIKNRNQIKILNYH
jgi:hypothetical protein